MYATTLLYSASSNMTLQLADLYCLLQIAIAPTGFRRHWDEMAQNVWRCAGRGRVKSRDFATDDLTRFADTPKNDIGVTIAECIAGAELDEIGMR